jgi:hypothetical protein
MLRLFRRLRPAGSIAQSEESLRLAEELARRFEEQQRAA